jgi:protein arginine kinase activator
MEALLYGRPTMKCDLCNNQAIHHLTEIKGGKPHERHLCEKCAAKNEGSLAKGHTPLTELLTNFVTAHSGLNKEPTITCEQCGVTWSDFREKGLLGCEHDYVAFEKNLTPVLQRAHENATHHIGKVPTRRGGSGVPARRQLDLSKLRKELSRAVEAEDYERAAKLRDQIKQAENG